MLALAAVPRWKLAGARSWELANFYNGFWSRAIQYLTGSLELEKVRFAKMPAKIQTLPPVELELYIFDEDFRPLSGPDIDVTSLRDLLAREKDAANGNARGEIILVSRIEGTGEVDILLAGKFPVSPAISQAIKAIPGVLAVREM